MAVFKATMRPPSIAHREIKNKDDKVVDLYDFVKVGFEATAENVYVLEPLLCEMVGKDVLVSVTLIQPEFPMGKGE